jgi:hypothetical protein
MDGELTPAGADLEHPGAGPDLGPVEEPFDLAGLSLAQVSTRLGSGHQRVVVGAYRSRREQRGGVAQARVEEQLEQVVRQVVVVSDVALGVRARALLVVRRAADGEGAELLQPRRHQGRHVGRQDAEEAAEVLGVPRAREVGLAEADQQTPAEPAEELLGPVDRHLGAPGPERAALEVDGHREPADAGEEQPPRDRGRDGRAQAGRDRREVGPLVECGSVQERGHRSSCEVVGSGVHRQAS